MKKIFLILTAVMLLQTAISQNVGIGVTNPSEKLDVNGGIKIGLTNNTTPGIIRWNASKNDFEGFNGTNWVSLTGSKGNWGSTIDYVHESTASDIRLQFNVGGDDIGNHLGSGLALINNYLLAGAHRDYDLSGTVEDAGSVRILKKENGIWKPQQPLWAPGNAARSQFGYSIAADGNQFIVGANFAPVGSNTFQGRAYIYGLNQDGTPVLLSTLTAANGTGVRSFGSSVDISGNYAIVGAQGYSIGGLFNRGIAYIYQKNIMTATWSEQAILNPPDGGEEDGIFGHKVSISGNIAVVASMFAGNGNLHRIGKVFVYRLMNNVWTHSQTLTPPNPQSFDRFGSDLVLKADTLMIGSPQWNGYELSNNGKVYMYVNANNNFELQATITAADGKKGDGFGTSLYFGNGLLIVGASPANVGASESQGKAYIFKLNGSNWEQQAVLKASNGNQNDQFGGSVIIGNAGAVVSSLYSTYQNYLQHGRLYFFEE
jgi:hypothetical protein